MSTTPISDFDAVRCGLLAVLCFWLVPVGAVFGESLAGLSGAALAGMLTGSAGSFFVMQVPPVGRGLAVFGMAAALVASAQTILF